MTHLDKGHIIRHRVCIGSEEVNHPSRTHADEPSSNSISVQDGSGLFTAVSVPACSLRKRERIFRPATAAAQLLEVGVENSVGYWGD